MNRAGLMRVVEFHTVRRSAVRERRISWSAVSGGANHRARALRRRLRQHFVNRVRGLRKRTGDRHTQIIEEQVSRAIDDLGAQVLHPEFVAKMCEFSGYGFQSCSPWHVIRVSRSPILTKRYSIIFSAMLRSCSTH